jgi:CubicO group peptidase (beta-lactamase class C family)
LGWMLKARGKNGDSSAGDLFSSDAYGHTGFTGTSLWIDPRRKLVVACLTNRVYPGRDREGIHAFRRALHDLIARAVDEPC